MALLLRRAVKTSKLFPPNTFNPSHLIPFTLHTQSPPHQDHTFLTKPNPNTQFNKRSNSSLTATCTFSDRTKIVEELTAIFTRRLLLQKKEELRALGEKLTPETVELVLKSIKSWRIASEFFSWAAEQDGYRHNCYTYNAMASILSRARKTNQLKILARDVVNSRCLMTAGAFGFFIRCLGSQGLVDEANDVFDQAKMMGLCVPNTYTYNCLLEVLAKSSSSNDLIEMRLAEMRGLGWDPDKFTLTPLLQAYCNAGKFEKALDVFNQIHDRGWVDVHVIAILVLSFSKWGDVDKAFKLIETMEDLNISLNEKTLCVLIHGFTRESRVDMALQLFEKMWKLGFKPDLPIYDVLIGGLCKQKELDKALDLYLEMKELGIFADSSIITKLLSSFCGEGDLVTANRLLEEGVQGLDVETLVLLYNAVLDGIVNHGLVDKALLLLQAMMGAECGDEAVVDSIIVVKRAVIPNATSFNIVIDGLCKKGQLDMALTLFRDMVQMGCKGNLLIYNNLIDNLCNLDRLEEGFKLLREMKKSEFKPTQFTYNSIFGCLCRREDVTAAIDLVREMREHGHEPWIKYSSLLVKQLCTHGKVLEASTFLSKMLQEGFLPDVIAYSAAIDGFFKTGDVDRAMELFQDICARGYHPDMVAYNILISGLCKVGRILEAQNVLDEILEKGLVPSVVTYNLLIDGWCKTDEIDRALNCLSRMVEEAREPTVITYTTLINGLCNVGRPDDALRIWNEMVEKGCSPNRIAYMALIHGLCKCSKADAALVYLHEMDEKEMKPDTYVYVALISDFLSKNPLLAFEILKDMVQKGSFPDPSDKNYPLLINVVHKLSKDATTSLDVQDLIAKGYIPTICSVLDIGSRNGEQPVG